MEVVDNKSKATRVQPSNGDKVYKCKLHVNCMNPEWSSIVVNALSVDSELQPEKLTREISIQNEKLGVEFASSDPKLLRAALNSFFDMLILSTKTLEEFA